MSFPNSCFRGIKKRDWISDDCIDAQAFQFEAEPRKEDGKHELSIWWQDNDHVLQTLLDQAKDDGSTKYEGGAAQILRQDLDRFKKKGYGSFISYERRVVPGNPAHGNLLLSNVEKRIKTHIMMHLAVIAQPVTL